MGIYDRDYMRSESARPDLGFANVIRGFVIVASIIIGFICLRIPIPIFGKIALIILALYFIRWLLSIPRKIERDSLFQQGWQLERSGNPEAAVRSYKQALARSPDDSTTKLRLLAVCNASLQVNQAKELIETVNGRFFQENEIEELEAIVTQYRKIRIEKKGHRYLVQLID